jgi:8-oxo-dGTP diphosphatase
VSVKQIRVVAALIPARGDGSRFLVQQRLPGKARANLWEFPGGKVEAGEGDEQALARECREELDVELKVGRRLWGTTHAYDDLTVTLELFAAVILTGEPKALGAQALRFCTFDEMRALPFCEADLPLLEALATGEIAAS